MKQKALVVVAAILFFAACKTTSTYRATDTVVVSTTPAETTFITQYPNASDVVWTYYDPVLITPIDWQLTGWRALDANSRMVHFKQDNDTYYVLYDRYGYRVASATVLTDFSVIPGAVSEVLTLRYPAYKVTGLSRVTMTNRLGYEVEMKKMFYTAKVLIDDSGNVIDQRLIVNEHM